MLKNKDCLHFLGHFFSLELWGSRVTDRALESAKNGFLVKIKNTPTALVHRLFFGVVRLPEELH